MRALSVIVLCLALPLPVLSGSEPFNPRIVINRAFPAIVNPPNIPSTEADTLLREEELVIGVTLRGHARAYPVNMLTRPHREIFNDELGEQAIAVTWCHLCHNAIVYDATTEKQKLTFVVSGMLWKHNLVMRDVETQSLWSHMLGQAMDGLLKGTRLKQLPSVLTTWHAWHRAHPETTAVALQRSSQDYDKRFYQDLTQFVFGYASLGRARAWRFDRLAQQPVVNDAFGNQRLLIVFDPESTAAWIYDRNVDGRTLSFELALPQVKDRQTGSLWDPAQGTAVAGPLKGKTLKPLVGIVAYRRAWHDFHPDSSYWQADAVREK
jgi:Protein of unknown function (DUF3179)